MESSLEFEVLHMLLEAGEENLATVFNTLLVTHGNKPRGELFERTARAIGALETKAEAEFAWYRNGWVLLTEEERRKLQAFHECLVWDAHLLRWLWNPDFGAEQPIFILTEKGRERARSELRRAG